MSGVQMEDKKYVYIIPADVLLECYDEAVALGREKGKQPGEDICPEVFEIAKKKGLSDKIQCIGETDKDIDMLTGELRDRGLKVRNLNEEERKNNKVGNSKIKIN